MGSYNNNPQTKFWRVVPPVCTAKKIVCATACAKRKKLWERTCVVWCMHMSMLDDYPPHKILDVQASQQARHTHLYIYHLSIYYMKTINTIRDIIIELTVYLFGALFFSLCLILLVATSIGSGLPLIFSMVVLGLLAGVALVNRILVWTHPRR